MAQKVQVLLVDDLDGSEATETVSFGLDGVSYEIDLSSGNAGELRNELAQYVEHARKANAPARRRRARSGAGREQSARIREWAKSRGFKVNERGRIPANIVAEYEAAHLGRLWVRSRAAARRIPRDTRPSAGRTSLLSAPCSAPGALRSRGAFASGVVGTTSRLRAVGWG